MPIYDFSSGLNMLSRGLGSLGNSLKTADQQAYQQAVGAKLQQGDYDGAANLAFARGDLQTGQALQQAKRQNDWMSQNSPPSAGGIFGNAAVNDGQAPSPSSPPSGSNGSQPSSSTPGGSSAALGLTSQLQPIADKATQQYGLHPSILPTALAIESAGGRNLGSRGNPGQFDQDTANEVGMPNATKDPSTSVMASGALFAKRAPQLAAAIGRDPTPAEVYLSYQQGVGGAAALINHPDVPAGKYVGSAAISQNGGDPNAPASQFVRGWNMKWNTTARKLGFDVPTSVFAATSPSGAQEQASPDAGAGTAPSPSAGTAGEAQAAPNAAPLPDPLAGYDNPTNRFIAGRIGPEATLRLLRANPDTPISQIIDPRHIGPATAAMTAGQFYKSAQMAAGGTSAAPLATRAQAVGAAPSAPAPGAGPSPAGTATPPQGAPVSMSAPAAAQGKIIPGEYDEDNAAAFRKAMPGNLSEDDFGEDDQTGIFDWSDASPQVLEAARQKASQFGYVEDPADPGHFVPGSLSGSSEASGNAAPPSNRAIAISRTPMDRNATPQQAQASVTQLLGSLPQGDPRRIDFLYGQALKYARGAMLGIKGADEVAKIYETALAKEEQAAAPPSGYMFYAQQERAAGRTPMSLYDWSSKDKTPQGQTELEYAMRNWRKFGYPDPSTIGTDPQARAFWSQASQKALGLLPAGPASRAGAGPAGGVVAPSPPGG